MKNEKIDLVYLWVDGSNSDWLKKKNKYLQSLNFEVTQDESGACRYIDNDELKFSLRSVERYMPWINHIFIVTDNQIPSWLNLEYSKVSIIDHKDIMNEDILPTFNSMVIEANIYKIPNLSDYFILANDDFFAYKDVPISFFFHKNKIPYCNFRHKLKDEAKTISTYSNCLLHTHELVKKKTGLKPPKFYPHHNMDAYTKSGYSFFYFLFFDEKKYLEKFKFRQVNLIERVGISYYLVATGRGVFRRIRKAKLFNAFLSFFGINRVYSLYFSNQKRNIEKKLKLYRPYLFCINDGEGSTDEDRMYSKKLLLKLFPNKSSFEN